MTAKNLFTLTLIKSLDILDCFKDDREEIGIKEIADMIGMPQSSVHRIIQSLEFNGMIYQNKETKKYRLGAKVLQMSTKVDCLKDFKDIAVKYMKQLNTTCDETINLAIANCDAIVNVYKVESSKLLRPNFVIGAKYPIYNTGLGKILLSDMSMAPLQWVYEEHKEEIGKSFSEFKAEIDQVKKQGYAVDDEEFSEGLRCVAAPIRGYGGKVLFSMSISAPVIRMGDKMFQEAIEMVKKYANLSTKEIQEMKISS